MGRGEKGEGTEQRLPGERSYKTGRLKVKG